MGKLMHGYLCPHCEQQMGITLQDGPNYTSIAVGPYGGTTYMLSCPRCDKAIAAIAYKDR